MTQRQGERVFRLTSLPRPISLCQRLQGGNWHVRRSRLRFSRPSQGWTDGQGRSDRDRWHGHGSAAQHHVPGAVDQRPPRPRHHRRQDAAFSDPRAGGRPRHPRAGPLRPHAGPHHVPPQVSEPLPDSPDQSAAAGWLARLAAYKGPDLKRSVWQLASAAALYAGAWALMYASLGVGYWLTLLLAVPAALFGVGAVLHFFVRHRLPTIVPRTWTRERRSILWTNVGLAGFVLLMGTLVGFREFLLVQLPVALLSCSIGVWLFYVQHQFEPTYWEHDERWAYHAAALEGSSYYRLPKLLQWATGNIGLHHIHHLNARIPNYRLQQVLETYPELRRVATLTLKESFRCVRLVLWDERARKLVPFPA